MGVPSNRSKVKVGFDGIGPIQYWETVTPDDSNDLPNGPCRAIYVGATGQLDFHDLNGDAESLPALAAGVVHPVAVKRVLTASTASSIRAGY